MTTIDTTDTGVEIARHIPSGDIYVLQSASLWQDGDCIGTTYIGVSVPLHHTEWQDDSGSLRADWAELPYKFDPLDAEWANGQEWDNLSGFIAH